MLNSENMNAITKQIVENIIGVINDNIMSEAKKYLEESKIRYPQNRITGYRNRGLTLVNYGKIQIKYPKFLKDNSNFNLSFLPKYSRHLTGDLEHIRQLLLKTNISIRDIERTLKMKVPKRLKRQINEFLETTILIENHKRYSYPILKLDSTSFSSGENKKSIYILWGMSTEGELKSLYTYIEDGGESAKGWENVITWLKDHIELEKVKVVVSDMFRPLKNQLVELNLPLQNCIFHRLESITTRIKVPSLRRRGILKEKYWNIYNSADKEAIKNILFSFEKYELTPRRERGKQTTRSINSMLAYYYEDNFTFLKYPEIERKFIFQTMDLETKHSLFKRWLRKSICRMPVDKLKLEYQRFKLSHNLAA